MSEFEPRGDDFSSRYPEIGEIKEGSVLDANKAKKLCRLMSDKLASLETKDASLYDGLFIDTVVMNGSSCLQRWVEDYDLIIPQETIVQEAVKRARKSILEIIWRDEQENIYPIAKFDEMKRNSLLVSAAINNVTYTYRSVRSTPEIYNPCIKYSQALMTITDRMAEYNEGLVVDEYVQGRLREITEVFIASEPE
jgi:hypothetical protein